MDTRERIAKILCSIDQVSTVESHETYLDVIMDIISETHVSLDAEVEEWEVEEECPTCQGESFNATFSCQRCGSVGTVIRPATVRDFIEGREVRKK